jgi:hypothetical protein
MAYSLTSLEYSKRDTPKAFLLRGYAWVWPEVVRLGSGQAVPLETLPPHTRHEPQNLWRRPASDVRKT